MKLDHDENQEVAEKSDYDKFIKTIVMPVAIPRKSTQFVICEQDTDGNLGKTTVFLVLSLPLGCAHTQVPK